MTTIVHPHKSHFIRSANQLCDGLAALLCLVSLGLSVVESTVNQDIHHWGLMYDPALQLKHGLIACKDVLIYYGILTSWIQSIGLTLFGENLRSLGITTGLFFSVSLLLQYHIFKTFLSRHAALFALLMIVLWHGYIIYPWSNYFTYTFELLAVVALIQVRGWRRRCLLAGFCIGLALLARYTAVQSVVPPFIIFFAYQSVAQRQGFQHFSQRCLWFGVGLLMPLLTWLAYLVVNQGLDNFLLHNILTLRAMVATNVAPLRGGATMFWSNILHGEVFFSKRDSRSIALSLLFALNLWVFCSTIGRSIQRRLKAAAAVPPQSESTVFLVSVVTLFSYLNGLNLYEVFRMMNGASIGVGLIFYYLEPTRPWKGRPRAIAGASITALSLLCLHWSNSWLFTTTSSVMVPWQFLTPQVEMVRQTDIPIFAGKFLTRPFNDRYHRLKATLDRFDPNLPIVNYTLDTISVLIDQNRPRLQKSPAYFPAMQTGLTDEVAQIQQAIAERRAIVLAPPQIPIPPGYRLHQQIDEILIYAPE
jgi:Dolichyl-phosphate-mannose-protein mannosyltransferase